jgi:hypothetical protein
MRYAKEVVPDVSGLPKYIVDHYEKDCQYHVFVVSVDIED